MEARKTAGVKALVSDALDLLERPYTEDVIDDVFFVIESRPDLLARYRKECERLGKLVVNSSGGYWVANFMDRVGEREVPAKKSTLIGQYSKLDKPAPHKGKLPTETEAALRMSDYYQLNRGKFQPWIRGCREQIIELLMTGMPVEQAFDTVVALHGASK